MLYIDNLEDLSNKYEGIKFEYYNPHPYSNDIKRTISDCYIRCVCKVLNKDYIEIYNEISDLAKKQLLQMNDSVLLDSYYQSLGFKVKRPSKEFVFEFMKKHPSGRFMIQNNRPGVKHIVAYIDGVLYDSTCNNGKITTQFLDLFLGTTVEKYYYL